MTSLLNASTTPMAIITYSITHLTHCEKIKFYYVLKGRDGKPGIVQRTHTQHLGKGVLLVHEQQTPEVLSFLTTWECPHATRHIFVNDEVAQ